MSEHTKEPWTAMPKPPKSYSDHGWRAMAMCGDRWMVAAPRDAALTIEDGVVVKSWDNEANARRIVACVNACAGYSTDDLELFGRFLSSGEAAALAEAHNETERQRDKLLDLLKELSDLCPRMNDDDPIAPAIADVLARAKPIIAEVEALL